LLISKTEILKCLKGNSFCFTGLGACMAACGKMSQVTVLLLHQAHSYTSSVAATSSPAATSTDFTKATGTLVMWNWKNQDQLKEAKLDFNTRYSKCKG
jgi:multiple sugar transport system substrate-binding protein